MVNDWSPDLCGKKKDQKSISDVSTVEDIITGLFGNNPGREGIRSQTGGDSLPLQYTRTRCWICLKQVMLRHHGFSHPAVLELSVINTSEPADESSTDHQYHWTAWSINHQAYTNLHQLFPPSTHSTILRPHVNWYAIFMHVFERWFWPFGENHGRGWSLSSWRTPKRWRRTAAAKPNWSSKQ